MRNVLVHVPKGQRQMVAALIRTVFAQEGEAEALRQWRAVADQLRERFPKIGALMDKSEADVLAHLSFPKAHRLQIHSTDEIDKRVGRDRISGARVTEGAKCSAPTASAAAQPSYSVRVGFAAPVLFALGCVRQRATNRT